MGFIDFILPAKAVCCLAMFEGGNWLPSLVG
jgi:hypothetical protein